MVENEEPRSETLAAYLEGEVTASEAAIIEAALADSANARRRLERLRRIQETLSSPIDELESLDLVPLVKNAARSPRHRRRRITVVWRAMAAVAACSAAVAAGAILVSPSEPEFRSKSAGSSAPEQDRWAGVQVYRVHGGSAPEPLGTRLSNTDGLLFSYTNLGPHPFEFLMIFAVDSRGEVRWFHPAYESVGMDPISIPIEKGQTNVLLPEVIRQDFAPGKVTVYALFTQRAMRVLEVEAWLVAHPRNTSGLLTREASLQTLTAWVEP